MVHATDAIDSKYRLGSVFGGLLMLGIVTSLPKIAVVVTATTGAQLSSIFHINGGIFVAIFIALVGATLNF